LCKMCSETKKDGERIGTERRGGTKIKGQKERTVGCANGGDVGPRKGGSHSIRKYLKGPR